METNFIPVIKKNMSDNISDLVAALVKAQSTMELAKKDKENPFYKSSYSDLATVIETAKPHLIKNGLAISQLCEETDGTTVKVTTMLLHTSGQYLSSTLVMKPVRVDPQGIGSAFTYCRRYAYAAIIGLASEEDDDGNKASETKTVSGPKTIILTAKKEGPNKGRKFEYEVATKKFIKWLDEKVEPLKQSSAWLEDDKVKQFDDEKQEEV